MGRRREIDRCRDVFAAEQAAGIALLGGAGIGKSALAHALAEELRDLGREVVRIAGSRTSMSIQLGAVASLIPVLRRPVGRTEILRSTLASIRDRGDEPLVLVVDDAHWLDDASATLVHQLVRCGDAFVILTIRSDEPVSDAVSRLWKERMVERIELEPLSVTDSHELVCRLVPRPVDDAVAMRIVRRAAGNPLFIRQLVTASETGTSPACADALPRDLVSTIEESLADLPERDRAALELVALSEPVEAALVEQVLGDQSSDDLARLEVGGLIASERRRRRLEVRLAHPLVGEVLRQTMPLSWANRARASLAEALLTTGCRRDGDALRVAMWSIDAGVEIRPDIAFAAAAASLLDQNAELAATILEHSAVDQAGLLAEHPQTILLRATIEARLDRPVRSLELLDALEGSTSLDDPCDLRGRALLLRFGVMAFQLDDPRALALDAADDDGLRVQHSLAARKAIRHLIHGRTELARGLLGAVPRDIDAVRVDLWVLQAHAMLDSVDGRSDRALDALDRAAHEIAQYGWDPSMPDPTTLAIVRARLLQFRGEAPAALCIATTTIEQRHDPLAQHGIVWLQCCASEVHRITGRPGDAIAAARAAARSCTTPGDAPERAMAWAHGAAAWAMTGDAAAAESAAQDAEAAHPGSYAALVAQAWAWIAGGRVVDGTRRLIEVLPQVARRNALEELRLVVDIVRLGAAASVQEHALGLVRRTDSALAALIGKWATGVVRRDGRGLVDVADELRRRGYPLMAAEALTAACVAKYARHHAMDSELEEQRRAWRRQLRGIVSPGLQPPLVQALLTPRVRDAAALAAQGVQGRRIAEVLDLSHRTVESYLRLCYARLGVAGRAELAALFEEDGPVTGGPHG